MKNVRNQNIVMRTYRCYYFNENMMLDYFLYESINHVLKDVVMLASNTHNVTVMGIEIDDEL